MIPHTDQLTFDGYAYNKEKDGQHSDRPFVLPFFFARRRKSDPAIRQTFLQLLNIAFR